MTDHWVSRERHCCKYCNVWMPSDKGSVRHHEQGRKHKEKVEEALKLNRRAKSDARNAHREIQNQLQQIEEAAHAKFEQDLVRRRTNAPSSCSAPTALPAPPPRRTGQSDAVFGPIGHSNDRTAVSMARREDRRPVDRGALDRSNGFDQEKEETEAVEERDDNGVYAVRGVVYLEGKKHETQLDAGSACQIWVEEQEQWLDALVEQATVHAVPNTELSFRRYTIAYMLPAVGECVKDEEKLKPVTERDVLADRLRIPLPANVTLEVAEEMVGQWRNHGAVEAPTRAPIVIDEHTGMGEWNTVEVRQIDESSEAVAQRVKETEEEAARHIDEQQRLDALEDLSSQGDNALGAFNPWGGTYKGVNLDSAADATVYGDVTTPCGEEEINVTASRNVSFKTRGQKKPKRRRIRTDDDD
ncbi:unnamed protein product [Hyaloperonospora brassicae]|uniref:Matrin-type domain-containing protein n=1 Tax=Hyaloperonospora brassicae TaxID=162125 RepID=A0AAV0TP84_HYABA|nr:unnamed protein product [Hyaloperonospora brassicae]